jgi:iron complex transport system substrate-binding protein
MKNKFVNLICLIITGIVLSVSFGGCAESQTTTQSSTQAPSVQTTQTQLPASTQSAESTSTKSVTTPATTSTSTTSTATESTTTTSTQTPTPTPTPTPEPTTTTTSTTTNNSGGGGGGGGGSSSYYIDADILGNSYKIKTNSNGKVLKDFTAVSDDAKFTLVIPAETIALGENGKRLTNLTVEKDTNSQTSTEGTEIVAPVYNFGPDNATFDPPITLTLAYDLSQFPDVAEDLLYFATFNTENTIWDESTEISPNTTQHTFTASINHFSAYTIIGHKTRVIEDMYGTELTIPAVINRILSGGPVETQLIYILAPEKLCSVNGTTAGIGGWTTTTSFWNSNWDGTAPYVDSKYLDLPNIGNGSSKNLSYEQINMLEPDVVLEGKTSNLALYRSNINAPVIGVNAGSDLLTQYESEVRFVGDLLGVPDKADDLIAYYNEAMTYVNTKVANISENETINVFYSERDGTYTDGQNSWHTELLRYCGGNSVADLTDLGLSNTTNTSSSVQVSMEQIYLWDEETPINLIILGRETTLSTYQDMMDSEAWQALDCVKKEQVFFRPTNPVSWFDGPPGYGQIIGMYWMLHLLYPNKTGDINLYDRIKEYYSEFLHYDLSNEQVDQLLSQPTP